MSPDSHQLHDPKQVTYPEIWLSFTQTGNYTYFERMLKGLNKVMCVKVQNRYPEEMTYPQFPQGNPPSQVCSNLHRREKGICYRTQNADGDTGTKGQALNLVSRKSWQEELPVSTINRSPFLRPWSRYQPENGVTYSHLTKQVPAGFRDLPRRGLGILYSSNPGALGFSSPLQPWLLQRNLVSRSD